MPLIYIEQATLASVFGESLTRWMNLGFHSEVYTPDHPAILKATFPATPETAGTIGSVLRRELLMGQIKQTDNPVLTYIHFTRDIHLDRQGEGSFNDVFPNGLIICGDTNTFRNDLMQGRSNLRQLPLRIRIEEIVERERGFVPGIFKRFDRIREDHKRKNAEKEGGESKIELPSAVLYAKNEAVGGNL